MTDNNHKIYTPKIDDLRNKKVVNKQQISLYACKEIETAISTSNGCLFTLGLIKAINKGQFSIRTVFQIIKNNCEGRQTPIKLLKNVKQTYYFNSIGYFDSDKYLDNT